MEIALETLTHRTDLIDLATFETREAAEQSCRHLATRGIETSIYDEADMQAFVFMSKPGANFKVQVREEDYAEAVNCLVELEKKNPQVLPYLYSCPDCGSFAVEYPQFSRKFFIVLIAEWMSNLGLFPKQCYCRKCHATWPKQRAVRINPRHLEWNPDLTVPPPA